MTRVALDLESTLADIVTTFVDEYNKRNNTHITRHSWRDWHFTDAPFRAGEFMEITGSNWKHRPHEIPATEDEIAAKEYQLYEEVDKLDVVTKRVGHETTMRAWLNTQNITYDQFKLTQEPKPQMDAEYDVFIDDHPQIDSYLSPGQHLFLYDQPYNKQVNTEPLNVDRIYSLKEIPITPERH